MKNNIKILIISFIFASLNLQAATVGLNPNNLTVDINQIFQIELVGSDFNFILDGGSLNATFDSSIIQVVESPIDKLVIPQPERDRVPGNEPAVLVNLDWEFFSNPGTTNNSSGTVTNIVFNSFLDRRDNGNLDFATIWFKAVGTGSTELTLFEGSANPFGSGGQNYADLEPLIFQSGTIVATPIPGAFWLMLSGVVLLFRKRVKN